VPFILYSCLEVSDSYGHIFAPVVILNGFLRIRWYSIGSRADGESLQSSLTLTIDAIIFISKAGDSEMAFDRVGYEA
jgi:hypothetical protein